MARVLCINDYLVYSEMFALLLQKKGGHEVMALIVPFEIPRIRAFNPDVILVNLVRKAEALGAPIHDFYTQVDGARALRAIQESPDTRDFPLVITAMAVTEAELPKGLDYVAFVEVPGKLDHLLMIIDQITQGRGQAMAPE